ncbi:hypothetical protein ARTHRO9AX_140005 [Arthrobacter sp. 9AX]|nr:hypothetical protein ARTHRO9AX_140005 [Arthrobacter sp. 9AX]
MRCPQERCPVALRGADPAAGQPHGYPAVGANGTERSAQLAAGVLERPAAGAVGAAFTRRAAHRRRRGGRHHP